MNVTDVPRDQPIGIFDSGVGGLTVMRAVADLLPHEEIVYLGDTARVPYGNRGANTVRRYALNATRLLVSRGIKALVIACNTATAYGMDALLERYDLPIVGVVEPVARKAAQITESGAVGVIGTRATVHSESYPRVLQALHPRLHVQQQACPLFVPLVEEGWTSGPVAREIAGHYLEAFRGTDIDTLILGCTHYPLLRETIADVVAEVMPHPVSLLDSATATAQRLRDILEERGLLRQAGPGGEFHFLVTDIPEGFVPMAERFFGANIGIFDHVDIVDASDS